MTGALPTSPLAEYPIVLAYPVHWGDQDSFGHVNNCVYFRWFESARIAYCDRLGLDITSHGQSLAPIMAAISCDFRLPINYPDTIQVGARVVRIGRTSMTMEHAILSEAAGAIAAQASSVLVVFDYKAQRPHPVPPAVREAIAALEMKAL